MDKLANQNQQQVFQLLNERHTLKYVDKAPKSRLIISFIAVPGSGKTYLANKIEEYFQLPIIRKDTLRDNTTSLQFKGKEEYIQLYVEKLIQQLVSSNKAFIVDSSLQRRCQQLNTKLDELNSKYKLLLIGIDPNVEIIKQRITDRNGKQGAQDYFQNMDRWLKEYHQFIQQNQSAIDISLPTQFTEQHINKVKKILKDDLAGKAVS